MLTKQELDGLITGFMTIRDQEPLETWLTGPTPCWRSSRTTQEAVASGDDLPAWGPG
jgi:hypothetical protein